MTALLEGCKPTNLGHDSSTQRQERSESQKQKSESPFDHEANDESTKEGGDPLNEQGYLVSNTIVDLIDITAEGGKEKQWITISSVQRSLEMILSISL